MPLGFEIRTFPENSLYCVSTTGDAYCLGLHPNTNLACTQWLDKDGYPRVWINGPKKVRRLIAAHRLVAITFLPKPSAAHVVNHKNGNKIDNRVENLEWILPADNERHARNVLGKRCVGEKASQSKLKTEDVLKIVFDVKNGKKFKETAKKFNISLSQVIRILRGKNWGHLWKDSSKLNARGRRLATWMNLKLSKEI